MRYYPLCLDLKGRTCLVVGGGKVGARKAKGLLAAGARVVVISNQMGAAVTGLGPHQRLRLERRAYRPKDMEGVFLAFAATDDAALNRRIQKDASVCRALCNIADQPELCDFILPAVVQQGDLALAITTAGKSPALAKRLRRELTDQFGPEYARLTELLGAIRQRLLSEGHDPKGHRRVFNTLLDSDLLGMLQADRRDDIDALLARTLGPGYRLGNLTAAQESATPNGSPTAASEQESGKRNDNRGKDLSGGEAE
jgi:precorrin-2 dehydrogenase / sirohydrochlorin ferrochelatase